MCRSLGLGGSLQNGEVYLGCTETDLCWLMLIVMGSSPAPPTPHPAPAPPPHRDQKTPETQVSYTVKLQNLH